MKRFHFFATAMCVVLFSSIIFVTGCGGAKDAGSPAAKRPLGQATKPGHFPDGTKAEPLPKEEVDQVMQSFSGALSVLSSVMELVPEKMFNKIAPSFHMRFFNSDDDLKKDIRENCQIVPFEPNMETRDGRRNGNNISGQFVLSGAGSISGARCPLSSASSAHGNGSFSGTVDNNDEVKTFKASGRGVLKHSLISSERLATAKGLKQFQADLNVIGSLAGQPEAQSLSLDVNANAQMDTVQYGIMDVQLLAQADVAQRGEKASGPLAVALVFKYKERTLLVQIFVNAENPEVVEIYVNGEKTEARH